MRDRRRLLSLQQRHSGVTFLVVLLLQVRDDEIAAYVAPKCSGDELVPVPERKQILVELVDRHPFFLKDAHDFLHRHRERVG